MVPVFPNKEDIERKTLLILRILHEAGGPLGSRLIARKMQDRGLTSSERAVRYHLKLMDERGVTRLVGKRDGRLITAMGVDELGKARVRDKVGLAISRIEILAFQTTFSPDTCSGLLPINISFFSKTSFPYAMRIMQPVFASGFVVSDLVATACEGQYLGDVLVPEGKIGFATVCSIVVNGVLLKHGIPMDSKFGGILQVKNRHPLRFVELIYYSGSSLDPSEIFIRGKMTAVGDAIEKGEGTILANFREIPAPCHPLTRDLLIKLKKAGINGVLATGKVSEPVCQVHVDMNKVGIILIGGLNPAACVQEAALEVEHLAMSTVMDYGALAPFDDLMKRI
ncbi:MAG: NrpR regulatory domain-containing protein [Deltaproteobacteria bacterium]|nr:NrpR regulatory domain-containing protein [Deltaproteobacteria bacterium]